ncbi:MAG: bacteriohemerythrin [Terracidiphilus sp.]
MAFMTWNDKLSVGVQTLDNQHKVLIETLNDLHSAMMKGQARAVAGDILSNLVKYTHDHFASEEAMMERSKYPGLSAHCLKHRELTKQVEDYVARLEKGDITLGVHLLNFLSDWLTKHIQGEDQKYGPCMNEHGIR